MSSAAGSQVGVSEANGAQGSVVAQPRSLDEALSAAVEEDVAGPSRPAVNHPIQTKSRPANSQISTAKPPAQSAQRREVAVSSPKSVVPHRTTNSVASHTAPVANRGASVITSNRGGEGAPVQQAGSVYGMVSNALENGGHSQAYGVASSPRSPFQPQHFQQLLMGAAGIPGSNQGGRAHSGQAPPFPFYPFPAHSLAQAMAVQQAAAVAAAAMHAAAVVSMQQHASSGVASGSGGGGGGRGEGGGAARTRARTSPHGTSIGSGLPQLPFPFSHPGMNPFLLPPSFPALSGIHHGGATSHDLFAPMQHGATLMQQLMSPAVASTAAPSPQQQVNSNQGIPPPLPRHANSLLAAPLTSSVAAKASGYEAADVASGDDMSRGAQDQVQGQDRGQGQGQGQGKVTQRSNPQVQEGGQVPLEAALSAGVAASALFASDAMAAVAAAEAPAGASVVSQWGRGDTRGGQGQGQARVRVSGGPEDVASNLGLRGDPSALLDPHHHHHPQASQQAAVEDAALSLAVRAARMTTSPSHVNSNFEQPQFRPSRQVAQAPAQASGAQASGGVGGDLMAPHEGSAANVGGSGRVPVDAAAAAAGQGGGGGMQPNAVTPAVRGSVAAGAEAEAEAEAEAPSPQCDANNPNGAVEGGAEVEVRREDPPAAMIIRRRESSHSHMQSNGLRESPSWVPGGRAPSHVSWAQRDQSVGEAPGHGEEGGGVQRQGPGERERERERSLRKEAGDEMMADQEMAHPAASVHATVADDDDDGDSSDLQGELVISSMLQAEDQEQHHQQQQLEQQQQLQEDVPEPAVAGDVNGSVVAVTPYGGEGVGDEREHGGDCEEVFSPHHQLPPCGGGGGGGGGGGAAGGKETREELGGEAEEGLGGTDPAQHAQHGAHPFFPPVNQEAQGSPSEVEAAADHRRVEDLEGSQVPAFDSNLYQQDMEDHNESNLAMATTALGPHFLRHANAGRRSRGAAAALLEVVGSDEGDLNQGAGCDHVEEGGGDVMIPAHHHHLHHHDGGDSMRPPSAPQRPQAAASANHPPLTINPGGIQLQQDPAASNQVNPSTGAGWQQAALSAAAGIEGGGSLGVRGGESYAMMNREVNREGGEMTLQQGSNRVQEVQDEGVMEAAAPAAHVQGSGREAEGEVLGVEGVVSGGGAAGGGSTAEAPVPAAAAALSTANTGLPEQRRQWVQGALNPARQSFSDIAQSGRNNAPPALPPPAAAMNHMAQAQARADAEEGEDRSRVRGVEVPQVTEVHGWRGAGGPFSTRVAATAAEAQAAAAAGGLETASEASAERDLPGSHMPSSHINAALAPPLASPPEAPDPADMEAPQPASAAGIVLAIGTEDGDEVADRRRGTSPCFGSEEGPASDGNAILNICQHDDDREGQGEASGLDDEPHEGNHEPQPQVVTNASAGAGQGGAGRGVANRSRGGGGGGEISTRSGARSGRMKNALSGSKRDGVGLEGFERAVTSGVGKHERQAEEAATSNKKGRTKTNGSQAVPREPSLQEEGTRERKRARDKSVPQHNAADHDCPNGNSPGGGAKEGEDLDLEHQPAEAQLVAGSEDDDEGVTVGDGQVGDSAGLFANAPPGAYRRSRLE